MKAYEQNTVSQNVFDLKKQETYWFLGTPFIMLKLLASNYTVQRHSLGEPSNLIMKTPVLLLNNVYKALVHSGDTSECIKLSTSCTFGMEIFYCIMLHIL